MSKILSLLTIVDVPAVTSLLLFMSGFAILSTEILGIKILAPLVGASMPVWGAVIGVTLFGGMLGYYRGGAVADTRRDKKTLLFLTVVAGVCIVLIPEFRSVVSLFAGTVSYAAGALLGSLVLLLIPTTALSALITYTIRLHVRDLDTIGQVHGDLYAIATVGSIAGVFATSYLLIPFYAVSHILYGLGLIIVLLGLCSSVRSRNPFENQD